MSGDGGGGDYGRSARTAGRTREDSLAHEFGHFLQGKYMGYSVANRATDDAESMAVEYQGNFRERYIKGGETPPCPPDG